MANTFAFRNSRYKNFKGSRLAKYHVGIIMQIQSFFPSPLPPQIQSLLVQFIARVQNLETKRY